MNDDCYTRVTRLHDSSDRQKDPDEWTLPESLEHSLIPIYPEVLLWCVGRMF